MSPADQTRPKANPPRPGIEKTLDGILERLRQGLEELAGRLSPGRPQPQPIPVPLPPLRRRRR